MANVVVVGSQWGDEGKGKIVDWLSERADIVVRFQGGHNAGHTLVIDGVSYKLSLLPSGVVRPGKLSVIGNGVVVDPWAFLDEVERLKAQGVAVTPENLVLAENAALILPLHRELDAARESANAAQAIGTTKRGIGPAYEDKVGRRAIRVVDLADPSALPMKVDRLLAHHNALRRGVGADEIDGAALVASLRDIAPRILPYAGSAWRLLSEARREGKRILFEGAQGALLDVDHGTYPFVTSSNTVAGQAAAGSGLGPGAVGYVLGITKAYTTGSARDRSRPRTPARRANFSAAAARSSAPSPGGSAAAAGSTRCSSARRSRPPASTASRSPSSTCSTASRRSGSRSNIVSTGASSTTCRRTRATQRRVEPVYETMEGWQDSTQGARTWNDLPAQAVKYVRHLEELIGAPVALLSTSPEREDTILVHDPFQG